MSIFFCNIYYNVLKSLPKRRGFMGRKLGFDSEQVLEKAMLLFWRVGYKKASIQQLMKAMGLGEGSFYHSFKNKKDLYLRCLKHYNTSVTYRRAKALDSSPSIKKALRNFFEVIFRELADQKKPSGCLMTNSLSSEVLENAGFKKYVLDEMRGFSHSLGSKLETAVKSGEFPKTLNAFITAEIIVTYIQGLFKMSLIASDVNHLKKQTEKFLESLGL